MTSISESSYGARLRRAQDLFTYLSGFGNYQPPRPEENIENLRSLVDSLSAANYSVSVAKDSYKKAVDERSFAFKKEDGSIEKLLVPIRGAAEALFGKKSTEMTILAATIRKMRSVRITKPPVDPSDPAAEVASGRSEKSYGSMTQFFNDIIAALEQFPGFDPSNERVKIPALKELASRVNLLNDEVAKMIQDVKFKVSGRRLVFEDLKARAQRIKAYVKGQYGIKSKEYILIKGMKF